MFVLQNICLLLNRNTYKDVSLNSNNLHPLSIILVQDVSWKLKQNGSKKSSTHRIYIWQPPSRILFFKLKSSFSKTIFIPCKRHCLSQNLFLAGDISSKNVLLFLFFSILKHYQISSKLEFPHNWVMSSIILPLWTI